jgi:hypothetical protein
VPRARQLGVMTVRLRAAGAKDLAEGSERSRAAAPDGAQTRSPPAVRVPGGCYGS